MTEATRPAAAQAPRVRLAELAELAGAWLGAQLRALRPSVRAEARYWQTRQRLIRETTSRALAGESDWMGGPGYGRDLDERVIEYPWLYARLASGGRLLDVGSSLNHPDHIEPLRNRFREVVFLNPFRDQGFRAPLDGVSYVSSDIRSHWLQAASFAQIACLSALEHVGCDNSRYGGPTVPGVTLEATRQARSEAMRAMRELVAPGGSVLVTVPFGRLENHGWFVQLDAAELQQAVDAFHPREVDATYFVHERGWRVARASDCAAARYGERNRGASAVACLVLSP